MIFVVHAIVFESTWLVDLSAYSMEALLSPSQDRDYYDVAANVMPYPDLAAHSPEPAEDTQRVWTGKSLFDRADLSIKTLKTPQMAATPVLRC